MSRYVNKLYWLWCVCVCVCVMCVALPAWNDPIQNKLCYHRMLVTNLKMWPLISLPSPPLPFSSPLSLSPSSSLSCSQAVTGVCYVPDTQTLWVAAGSEKPAHFEPRSGDNVRCLLPSYIQFIHITSCLCCSICTQFGAFSHRISG